MTANTSNKWISPPATWNTVKPPSHAINRMTNKTAQMLISFSSDSRKASGTTRPTSLASHFKATSSGYLRESDRSVRDIL